MDTRIKKYESLVDAGKTAANASDDDEMTASGRPLQTEMLQPERHGCQQYRQFDGQYDQAAGTC